MRSIILAGFKRELDICEMNKDCEKLNSAYEKLANFLYGFC